MDKSDDLSLLFVSGLLRSRWRRSPCCRRVETSSTTPWRPHLLSSDARLWVTRPFLPRSSLIGSFTRSPGARWTSTELRSTPTWGGGRGGGRGPGGPANTRPGAFFFFNRFIFCSFHGPHAKRRRWDVVMAKEHKVGGDYISCTRCNKISTQTLKCGGF